MITISTFQQYVSTITKHLKHFPDELQEGFEIYSGIIRLKGIEIFNTDAELKRSFENYLKELNTFLKLEEKENPAPAPSSKPKKVPAKKNGSKLSPIKRIFIHWHEGTDEFGNYETKSWNDLQEKLLIIYRDFNEDGGLGYNKVKVEFEWENGKLIVDRIDVGNSSGDFNPTKQFIGDYLKGQNGVMYDSNFNIGERSLVSWSDDNTPGKSNQPHAKIDKAGNKAKGPGPKQATVQKTKTVKPLRAKASAVALIHDDVKIIRKYVALNDTTPTRGELNGFLAEVQRAIVQERISKKSNHWETILHIQDELKRCHDLMLSKKLQIVKIEIEPKRLATLKAIAESEVKRISTALLEKYISLAGRANRKGCQGLLNQLEAAINGGAITQDDPNYNQVKKAIANLNSFLSGKDELLAVGEAELNGLKGLGLWPVIATYIATKAVDKVIAKSTKAIKEEVKGISKKKDEGVNPEYKFFVFDTEIEKVVAGNEYENDAKDELNEFKENYPEKKLRVFTARFIKSKYKINPYDFANWKGRAYDGLGCAEKVCTCNKHLPGLGSVYIPPVSTVHVDTSTPFVAPSSPVPVSDNDGFVQADNRMFVKAPGTFRLPGELGNFIQDIQPFKYSIIITGDPHAGKTEFVTQLIDGFISAGKTVGMFSIEQGGIESKHTAEAIDRNISRFNQSRLSITGEAKEGIATLKKHAGRFDVVVVDSWQKLKIPNTLFDSLRHEHPNTIWIIIFQQNGEGGTRGGVASDYDTPVALKVHKVDSSFVNNYVELIKNRGNSLNYKYVIAEKRTVPLHQGTTTAPLL